MGNISETSIFEEMEEQMEDFFEYMDRGIYGPQDKTWKTDLIHEVDGEVVTEPLEDVLEREDLEMKAELSVGI